MMRKKEKVGYGFERAVYDFASRLDPKAEVLFDHKVPDKDTGTPRQCDVWINARFGGHIPISILVSCKDHGRKLDVGDIGSFCDEVRSTRASTGVIYARSGFTKPALEKAKANGLSCCRLYLNEPGELPESLVTPCFLSNPRIAIAVKSALGIPRISCGVPLNEIFNVPLTLPDGEAGLFLDVILSCFYEQSHESVKEAIEADRLPREWHWELYLGDLKTELFCTVLLHGSWKHYRSLAKATLLNGSYCLTDSSYFGWVFSPKIHRFNANPGDEWEQIEEDTPFPTKAMIIPMMREIRQLVIDYFGPEISFPDMRIEPFLYTKVEPLS